MIAVAEDRSRRHEHLSSRLELRLQQVSEMHDAKMAEVLAEMEELEATSSPRFHKIDTPDFGVHALNVTKDGQPMPMQPQTANFPIAAESCKDCGHAQYATTRLVWELLSQVLFSGAGGADGSTHHRPGKPQGHGYESF
eukprot:2284788-Amphidinium_carterae.1